MKRLMFVAASTILIIAPGISQETNVRESGPAMSGSPPNAKALVTPENFEQSQMKFRWAVQHFRELFPTHSVTNDSPHKRPLVSASRRVQQRLSSIKGLGEKLDKLEVDCFIVLQDGKVAAEHYFHGMRPDTKHFVLSVHKSIVATVIASLIADSKLSMEATVDSYVPELKKSAFKGVTIRQALDMLSSVDYTYLPSGDERPTFERHKDALLDSSRFRGIPVGSQSFLLTLPTLDRPHGMVMRYKEADPAILVWAAERAEGKRFATIAKQRLWSRIGAEHQLEAVCDPVGFWTHYVSCSARDLARWGQMLADHGNSGEQSVVPSSFVDDIRKNARIDLLRDEPFVGAFLPKGIGYRSFFYLDGQGRNAIAAMGGYGQLCYISPDTKTVVVIFSSPSTFAERLGTGHEFPDVWQNAKDEELARWQLCRDICSTLSQKQFASDGTQIAYNIYGEGPAVVIVHGVTGSQQDFTPLARKFAKAGFRAIVFDVRGHGASEKPRGIRNYGKRLVTDIRNMLDHLSIESAHVIGYSMGGDIVNKFREMYPGETRSCVIGGAGLGVSTGWADEPHDFAEIADSLKKGEGFKPLLQLPGAISPGVATEEAIEATNISMTNGQDTLALAALLSAYDQIELNHNKLDDNTVPTLVVVGSKDAEYRSATELNMKLRNSKLHTIQDANHFEAWQRQEFDKTLIEFVRDIESSR